MWSGFAIALTAAARPESFRTQLCHTKSCSLRPAMATRSPSKPPPLRKRHGVVPRDGAPSPTLRRRQHVVQRGCGCAHTPLECLPEPELLAPSLEPVLQRVHSATAPARPARGSAAGCAASTRQPVPRATSTTPSHARAPKQPPPAASNGTPRAAAARPTSAVSRRSRSKGHRPAATAARSKSARPKSARRRRLAASPAGTPHAGTSPTRVPKTAGAEASKQRGPATAAGGSLPIDPSKALRRCVRGLQGSKGANGVAAWRLFMTRVRGDHSMPCPLCVGDSRWWRWCCWHVMLFRCWLRTTLRSRWR